MATPNTSISPLGISDVNVELKFPSSTSRRFNDSIFRNLTGVQSKTIANTSILISDVSDKSAMDGIISPTSNSASGYGTVRSVVLATVDSDMVNPEVFWSYNLISGGGAISLQPDGGKNATLTLENSSIGVQTANVQLVANVYFEGQQIGSASKYINLSSTSFNPALVVSGTLVVNNQGFTAQTAFTQISASSNVVGGVITFSTSPPFGGVVTGNTITFSSSASNPGVDNNNIYTLTTSVVLGNTVVASNTVVVNTRATFVAPAFDISVPSSTNNVFANSGPANSSLRITASHAVPSANVTWAATKVSGDDATLLVVANNAYANLTVDVASFGAKKSVYDIVATLQYSNGYVLNTKTERLTLRTAAYGLSFVAPVNATEQGYNAQTAISSGSATYRAGTFSWDASRISGSVATVSQQIEANTAAITLSLSAPSGIATSQNRVNPVITFDGIVIANVSSVSTLTADVLPFTFSLSGPTVNTQVGEGTVGSSALTTATHNVASGYVVWSVNNGSVAVSSNTSTANLSIATTAINSQTAILNAKLYDQFNRLVSETNRTITIRAYSPDILFTGLSSISNTGYSAPVVSNVLISASCRSGANSFNATATKLSGDTLSVSELTGNTTADSVSISSIANSVGTLNGQYRITATVDYFGTTFSKTFDSSISASLINPNYTLVSANGSVSGFSGTVTANAEVQATFSLPGGSIQWSSVDTGPSTLLSANNSVYRFQTSRTGEGTTSSSRSVTGTLVDSIGRVAQVITIPATAVATVLDPQLVITGTDTVSVSNTFQATASVTLVAANSAALVGAVLVPSVQLVSGDTATVTIGSNSVTLDLIASGVTTKTAVYDVGYSLLLNGTKIAGATRRATLTATATSPVINFASANAAAADFNFPVATVGTVTASSTPAGIVEFTVAKVSGDDLTVNILANQVNLSTSRSAVGVTNGTYNVTALYKTPGGAVITSRSATVNVSAERFDPGFSWTWVQGETVETKGWEEDISAINVVQASANASLPSPVFSISGALVSGPAGSLSQTSSSATITLNHNRTTHGVLASRESIWDVTCSLVKNSQVLSGPFTRRVVVRTTPYNLVLTPPDPSRVAIPGNSASAISTLSSNHEQFASTTISWSTSFVSGNSASTFSFSNSGGINNRITGSLALSATAGQIRTSTTNFTATFFANGANRSVSGQFYLETQSTSGSGPIN